MVYELRSAELTVDDDPEALFAFTVRAGWSDGLPAIAPTRQRVEAMLRRSALPPDHDFGRLGPKWGLVTVEKIAINAVMAGCLPEYLPVVIAAVEGMMDERFNVHAIQATTNPATVMAIVNGPIARQIGVESGAGAMGAGFRANATIGRAVRLVMRNVGGAIPGHGDQSTHGSPAKYAYCFAENETESPWPSLHTELGFAVTDSAVTVSPVSGPDNVVCLGSADDARAYLRNLGKAVANHGSNVVYMQDPEVVVVLGPDSAKTAAKAGITKDDARQIIFDNAVVPLGEFAPGNIVHFERTKPYAIDGDLLRPLKQPDRIKIVVAGGPGEHSTYCGTFNLASSITTRVHEQSAHDEGGNQQ